LPANRPEPEHGTKPTATSALLHHRRRLIVHLAKRFALLFILLSPLLASAHQDQTTTAPSVQTADSPPPASLLEAGDLLWPKVPGVWVPYSSRPGVEQDTDSNEWNKEREAYLQELRAKNNPTDEDKARYRQISGMDYATFKVLYLADEDPAQPAKHGSSFLYVGHVGIVDVVDGTPWVYEAVYGKGVRMISYSAWLEERRGELVWLGRISNARAEQRSAIAACAKSFIGKPYHFFNFNLSDTTGFYCSKLAWLSITTATGVAPDDNPNPRRLLWYSPKRLMRSKHVTLLYNPGNYAIR
jgi:cell wall-associated NlpC family hydrolase